MMGKQKNVPSLRFSEFEGEWERKRLGEVADVKGGKRIPKQFSLLDENNGNPYITVSDMKNDTVSSEKIKFVPLQVKEQLKKYKITTKDIFISVAGTLGSIGIIPESLNNANLTENANKLTNLKCNQFYLFQILKSFRLKKLIENTSTIGAQPKLAIYALNNLELFFPSLPEQQKIASFLTAIDEKLQALKQQKALLEQYKKGMMQKIFSQEIRFKDENGKAFGEWEMRTLGEICKTAKSGGTPTSTKKEYYDGNIPFLSISDMTLQGKYLGFTSNHISQSGINNSSSWIVPPGSIIYSMYASVGFVTINIVPVATSQAVLNLILKEYINTEFIYYVLLDFQKKIKKFITTGTQGNLNAQSVKNFEINLPPLPEQTKIANFLSAIDEKISHCQVQIAKTEQYKKGLLQQLFV